jgi:hypothetical protein
MIDAGWVVYATDASEEGKAECKAWCKAKGLTPEDVRIVIREGNQCIAITKRKVTY